MWGLIYNLIYTDFLNLSEINNSYIYVHTMNWTP